MTLPVPLFLGTPSTVVDFAIHPGEVICLDGDSITAGSPDPTFSWAAPFQTAVLAAFAGAGKTAPVFFNTAVSGRTSTTTAANVATPLSHKPQHIFLLSSINDPFFGITPATTAANYNTYRAAVHAAQPGCRIHVVSNLWGNTEHWPDGTNLTNPSDAAINATNAAIVLDIAPDRLCKYYDVRTPLFATIEPVQNPANLATGQLIQSPGGEHPTKVATPPATLSGIQVVSNFMLAAVPLDLT